MKTLKLIKSENHNGFISVDTIGTNSLSFNIDLPVNAVVDHVRIKGEFNVDGYGTQKDMLLEDIACPVVVTYHRELAFEAYNPTRMQRVAATVHFLDGIPVELHKKVQGGLIGDFEVCYHEEAVTNLDR